MKKQLLQLFLLITALGFSQSDSLKIQNYINQNKEKLGLSTSETNQWIIQSETSSETTGIVNYLVMQSYNNIKIDNSYIYFWIKKGEIINEPEGFINNVSSKVNTVNPAFGVVESFNKVLNKLGENTFSTTVLSSSNNKFKLSNGELDQDPIRAELVYFPNQNGDLRLSWSYEFYSQNAQHLWKIKIDATSGEILEKYDLVHNCTFGPKGMKHNCSSNENVVNFSKEMFKSSSLEMLTPGTTNYRVIPFNYESPNHSPRVLIVNPEAATALAPSTNAASPNGWHNANAAIGGSTPTYNFTRGNNVFAYADFNNANPSSAAAIAGITTYAPASSGTYPNLIFDHAYGGTGVTASSYINAATTNLFYMNNVMHDLWYQYGFTETNRNFQSSNYGRGGSQGDYVLAESQDGSQATTPSFNNANFATPSDGSRPRMQMYLWDVGPTPKFLTINSPASIAGEYNAANNVFSPGNVALVPSPGVTQDLVLYDDGTPENADACTPAINAAALNGKIAVIRRGVCTFAEKVKFAQNAGAIAVIIVNNDTANPDQLVNMSGADATITIPAIFVSYNVGEAIIAEMLLGTVNGKIKNDPTGFVNSDGDFDNGIIAHEYTHGISTRLVGGGAGMGGSAEQPGEGWSDWAWLIMQIKPGDTRFDARGIATFAVNQPVTGNGIREYRYSTDMSVNPHTFGDTNTQWYTDAATSTDRVDVHGLGSIWCVMLWDLTWNYIDKYGYDPNIYNGTGGNNKVMRLVLDAMKLTPANPSLVQCRNAIIQADINTTNGEDYCMIWETFARRGLGVNATSGTTFGVAGVQDQVEDFTTPIPGSTPATGSNCTLSANNFETSNWIKIYPNPNNGILNVSINNYSGNLNINIYDINGRNVYTNSEDFSGDKMINLQGLQSGFYIVKMEAEGLSHTEKIVLQ
ncbi:T9SS-dependent M36 family metallopeptidase [Flavobacterium sp. N2820]|uniref:T9SS-dependent M36 family metallopeptidase n=1 Tax=Flavobacterium sp. N2820 TaxID=2986834 RepID=UPI00222471B2|nr:T9SS-dependent M36 family metallopeptidase [Flavobacterium sp. N2820]